MKVSPTMRRFSSGSTTPARRSRKRAEGGGEGCLAALGLRGAEEAVVDEDADELVADGAVDEGGGDGGVDAAGEGAEHAPVAHLPADHRDRIGGEGAGGP